MYKSRAAEAQQTLQRGSLQKRNGDSSMMTKPKRINHYKCKAQALLPEDLKPVKGVAR